MIFRNKKVLLVGLGTLGGGTAIANFLLSEGAKLTINDLKSKNDLLPSLKKLKGKFGVCLGRHDPELIKNNELIVFNPGIYVKSPLVIYAKELRKEIENDFTLFSHYLKNKKPDAKIIAVTGTRGKTTTTTWISHFLKNSIVGGNMPEKGLLKIAKKPGKTYALELSSFQLEFVHKNTAVPRIAVITNLYNDHLNRYKKFQVYLKTKANIFSNQTKTDHLILSKDNKYTHDLLKLKPKAKIYYFSLKKLPNNLNGLFFNKKDIYFQENGKTKVIYTDKENLALHHKANLLSALLAAYLECRNWPDIVKKIKTLPQIPFRQEIILKNKNLTVVNDSAGTSPDATIAAIDRFSASRRNLILITGGTDKNLDFKDLAKNIKKNIKKNNLFLLEGSATKKLMAELGKIKYPTEAFASLKSILESVKKLPGKKTVVFSPGAASFEKFKNEFARGRKFNALAKRLF